MDIKYAGAISVDSSEGKLVSEKCSIGKISKSYRNIKRSKLFRNTKEILTEVKGK